MRIILYTGKGGVGKTSIAAATGLKCAKLGYKSLILSLDPAHSISDSFDVDKELLDLREGEPLEIRSNLDIQEIDVHVEIEQYWEEIYKYIYSILTVAGIDETLSEELAILPGMEDEYFEAIQRLFNRLDGVNEVLRDPEITTARLITNPEKMVFKETQRSFTYFNLFNLIVDAVIINRIIPEDTEGDFIQKWKKDQKKYIEKTEKAFAPVPILKAPMMEKEVLGVDMVNTLSELIYDKDPSEVFYSKQPCEFTRKNGRKCIKLQLPFAGGKDIDLKKLGDKLIIKVGGYERHLTLPRSYFDAEPQKAKLQDGTLTVLFKGGDNERKNGANR